MADGIIQFIKLALDRASLKQLEKEASEESRAVAQAVARQLGGQGPETDAIRQYVERMRGIFERAMLKIRHEVAQGIMDVPTAERQAQRVADAFNRRLKAGLEKLSAGKIGMGHELMAFAAARVRPEELWVEGRGIGAVGAIAAGARAGKDYAEAWRRTATERIGFILSSASTWTVKAGAMAQLGRKVAGEFIDNFQKHARAAMAMTFTGGWGWQQGLNQMAQNIRAKVNDAFTLVDIPAMKPLSKREDKQLWKEAKGNQEAYRNAVLRTQIATQLANAQLTTFGKLVQKLGIDAFAASGQVQRLNQSIVNLGGSSLIRNVQGAGGAFISLGKGILSVAKSFGLLYSVYSAGQFFKDSVIKAGEAQKSWARLSVTLSDFGLKMSSVQGEINRMIRDSEALGYTHMQVAEILARLVQITGDYEKAARALPTVLDVTASGYLTMEQAMRNVGRAMIGDIGNLQRYGIFLEKNVDAVDQLSQRFGGEAAARAKTFHGFLERMNAAWLLMKVTLGNVIIEGTGVDKKMGSLVNVVHNFRKFIIENQEAVKAWAFVFKVALAIILGAILAVIWTVVKLTNVLGTVVTGIKYAVLAIPNLFKLAYANVMTLSIETFGLIAKLIDKVFGSNLDKQFDILRARIKELRDEAKAGVDETMAEGSRTIADIWAGSKTPQLAPDFPVGSARHPRARYHQNVRAEILNLRRVTRLGDEEQILKAEAKLNEMLAEQQKFVEETAENYREQQEYLNHVLNIQKILADLEKRRAGIAEQNRKERELTARIERLSQVALSSNNEAAILAMKELSDLHADLVKKREKANIMSEEYWKLQVHIKQIEDGQAAVLSDIDEKFQKQVEMLGEMIDLDIDRESAAGTLLAMHKTRADLLEDETLSVKEQLRIRKEMIQIEQAMRREQDITSRRIQELGADLQNAETRQAAERELIKIRNHLNSQLAKGLVLSINEREVRQQIADIDRKLAEEGVDVKTMERRIRAAEELAKSGRTRERGVAELLKIEAELQTILEKTNLTLDERVRLEAMLERIQKGKRKFDEPSMDFGTVMQQILTDLPEHARNAAEQMTDTMHTAFTFMLRDARNLRTALQAIPRGLAKAMMMELAEVARGKAKEHLAWMVSEIALGFGALARGQFDKAGLHFKSSAEHLGAATAWSLFGGAAGSLGMSAARAEGNMTGQFQHSQDRGPQEPQQPAGPEIHMYFSWFDKNNPDHHRQIGEAAENWQRRTGGRIVTHEGWR